MKEESAPLLPVVVAELGERRLLSRQLLLCFSQLRPQRLCTRLSTLVLRPSHDVGITNVGKLIVKAAYLLWIVVMGSGDVVTAGAAVQKQQDV